MCIYTWVTNSIQTNWSCIVELNYVNTPTDVLKEFRDGASGGGSSMRLGGLKDLHTAEGST